MQKFTETAYHMMLVFVFLCRMIVFQQILYGFEGDFM